MTFPLDDRTDIRSLRLSVRAINCLIRANISTLEELRHAFGEHFLALPGLGLKTFREIESFLRRSQRVKSPEPEEVQPSLIRDVSLDPATDVRNLPLSARAINCLIKHNISTLADLQRTFGQHFLSFRGLGRKTLGEIQALLSVPRKVASSTPEEVKSAPPSDLLDTFYSFLFSLSVRDRHILCSRRRLFITPFATLQELGDRHSISRERVRQIEQVLASKLIRRISYMYPELLSQPDRVIAEEKVVRISDLAGKLFSDPKPEHRKLLNMVFEFTGKQYIKLDTDLWAARTKATTKYHEVTSLAKDLVLTLGDDVQHTAVEVARRLSLRSPDEVFQIRKILALSPEFTLQGNILSLGDEAGLSMAMQRRKYAYEYIYQQGVPVNKKEIHDSLMKDRPELFDNVSGDSINVLRANLDRDQRLAWAGPSTYALVEWGYDHNVRSIGDAAYNILRLHGKPMPLGEIQKRIIDLYRVSVNSIAVALNVEKGKRFIRISKGNWTVR